MQRKPRILAVGSFVMGASLPPPSEFPPLVKPFMAENSIWLPGERGPIRHFNVPVWVLKSP